MKHSLFGRILLLALVPFTLALALLGLFWAGFRGATALRDATAAPPTGMLQVGFIDSPSLGFQRIALSIQQVRVNPSTNPNVSETDNNWFSIYLPPEVSGVGAAYQVNFLNLRRQVQLFSTVSLPAQVYNQIEVQFLSDPGVIVPSCTGIPFLEGCIAYGISLTTGTSLRTSAPVPVIANTLTQLVLELDPGTPVPPSAPGGTYQLTPTLSVVSTSQTLAQVSGTVSAPSIGSGFSVTAVQGSTIISQVPVSSSGTFLFGLPAPVDGSATYDLYASGPGVGYGAFKGLQVSLGSPTSPVTLSVSPAASFGTITGSVTDAAGNPLGGALVELLFPASNTSTTSCVSQPSGCVTVASQSASSGAAQYTFPNVPFVSGAPAYALRVSYSGHDTVLSEVIPPSTTGGTATCSPTTNASNCSFALSSATITGTASVDVPPPPGSEVEFVVIAEETGTQNIVSATPFPVVIPAGRTSASFSLEVPTQPGVYDLVATTLDFFQNQVPSTYTGHDFLVLSAVPAGASNVDLGTFTCVGHGSVAGIAASPSSSTSVQLFKCAPQASNSGCSASCALPNGAGTGCLVSVLQSSVTPASGHFSFCAPPDTYTVTRSDNGATNASTTVVVPTPAPISSPCPSTCQGAEPGCPGVCVPTSVGTLAAPSP